MLAGLICATTVTSAQCHFQGTVIDEQTGEPLPGVVISLHDHPFTSTGMSGEFRFDRPCADTVYRFSIIGYEDKIIRKPVSGQTVGMKPASTFLDLLIVSANRYEQSRSSAPIAISAISTELLSETKPQRLDEVLNKVEGVHMVDLGSEQHTMAIRQPINYKGLFLYLEDGIPIRPTGVFNHNALLEMNMAALSRIEVIRGPASSLYGSEAIGGAINFISLRPAVHPSGYISIQGNTSGYRRADFNASNTFGKIGVGAYGYYAQRKDGIRQHSDFDKLALTLQGNYIINDRNTLKFDLTYVDYYADMTGSMDSTFFYGKDFSSQHTFTNRQVDALRTKLSYHHFWGDDAKTSVTALARNNSIRQNPSYRVQDDYSPWSNPRGDRSLAHGEINEDRVYSLGLIAQHTHPIPIFRGSNLSVGINIDWSPDHFTADYIAIDKNPEGVYTNFHLRDSVLTDYEVLLLNTGLYANWTFEVNDWLQLTAAMRYDRLNYDFRNNLDENAFSGAPDDVDNFRAITPKVGLNLDLQSGNGLYANYSQGFLPPQITELYRGVRIPVLQPSVYHNYELGGYFQWGKKIGLDVSLYQLNGKNEIITVLLDDGSEENRNAGQTIHRGIEYGLRWQIWDDLHFRWSGTNAVHKFGEYEESGNNYAGNEMGQAPSWIANTELAYKPSWLPTARIALEWQYVDQYFMDHANTGLYPGYQIWNIRAGYEIGALELWVNAMNVTDELYATVVRRSQWGDSYQAGEPRTITVGLGYTFKKKNNE